MHQRAIISLAIPLAALSVALRAAIPPAQGRVNDWAGALDEGTKSELSSLLQDLERQTSAEIAVVTISGTDGMSAEEYANQLFNAWGIGKKGADNGVLILIVPSERTIRIEVGYGLEAILPDGLAGEIIRADFLPALKSGDYSRAARQGVRHVADVVRQGHVVTPDERRQLARRNEPRQSTLVTLLFFALFIAPGAFVLGAGVRTRSLFPLMWGAMFAGIPLVMTLSAFNTPIWILGPFALVMSAWGYVKGPGWWAQGLAGRVSRTSSSSESSESQESSESPASTSDSDFGGGSSGGAGATGSW